MGLQREVCVPDVVASEDHHATEEDRACEDHYRELPVEEVAKVLEPTGDGQAEDGEAGDEGVGVEGEQGVKDVEEKEGGKVSVDHCGHQVGSGQPPEESEVDEKASGENSNLSQVHHCCLPFLAISTQFSKLFHQISTYSTRLFADLGLVFD